MIDGFSVVMGGEDGGCWRGKKERREGRLLGDWYFGFGVVFSLMDCIWMGIAGLVSAGIWA